MIKEQQSQLFTFMVYMNIYRSSEKSIMCEFICVVFVFTLLSDIVPVLNISSFSAQ